MGDDAEDHGVVDGGHDDRVVEDEVGDGTAGRHRPHADHRPSQHPHVQQALATGEETENDGLNRQVHTPRLCCCC